MLIERFSLVTLFGVGILITIFTFTPPKIADTPSVTAETSKRVMIFPPVLWHYLSVDMDDRHILAIAKYMKEEAKATFLEKLYPNISEKDEAFTTVGAVPLGVEQIMLLKPDRVFTWEYFSSGLDIVHYPGVVKVSSKSFDDKVIFYNMAGELSGHNERAYCLIQRANQKMQAIERSIPVNTPTVSLVVLNNTDNFFMWGAKSKSFNTNIKRIKAVNIAESIKSGNGTTNIETLIALNPKVIFLTSYFKNPLSPKVIYNDPRLQSLQAVKNKKVYEIPTGISRMEGPVEEPILIEWMTQLLHPDIQSNYNLRDEIRQTYQTVYGYKISDIEIDKMLHIEENKFSSHYKIFEKENYVSIIENNRYLGYFWFDSVCLSLSLLPTGTY